MEKHSRFKDFITFLATVRGDLANITAPPFFLAPQSALEIGKCFTERPSAFAAPAAEENAETRALLVLKWFLGSMKSHFYVGQDENAGIRKPLNAFLGELYFGQWAGETSTTKIITEQVSHHPPITACYLYDEENGIRGDGYTRVDMTFSGYLNVRQTGNAMLHIDNFSEDYLIPFPNVQVRGFLSGKLYPELIGTYHIISTSGYVSEINFVGRGLFSGVRNSFNAKIYQRGDKTKTALFTVDGQWNDKFTIRSASNPSKTETYAVNEVPIAPQRESSLADQDPWESRRAWETVLKALAKGDMQETMREKSKLEQAQRRMRRMENLGEDEWEPKFFTQMQGDYTLFDQLASHTGWQLEPQRTRGVWKYDQAKADAARPPYHGNLTPYG